MSNYPELKQCTKCSNQHEVEDQDVCEYCATEELFEMSSETVEVKEPKGTMTVILRELFKSDLVFMYMLFKKTTLLDILEQAKGLYILDSEGNMEPWECKEQQTLISDLEQAIKDMFGDN